MNLTETFDRLEKSSLYEDWQKDHSDFKLTSAFYMSGTKDDFWQIGFANEECSKMFVFEMRSEIVMQEHGEMLKTPDSKIGFLDLSAAKVDLINILDSVEELRKKEYSTMLPMKKMIILQNVNDEFSWNITLVCESFKTINFNIDPVSGEIRSHKIVSIIEGM